MNKKEHTLNARLSDNLAQELGPAPNERRVRKLPHRALCAEVQLRLDLAEAVEVKLSHERRPVAVFVECGNNLLCESIHIKDHERCSVGSPAAQLRAAGVDHGVRLAKEQRLLQVSIYFGTHSFSSDSARTDISNNAMSINCFFRKL
jgi:hypothetical protein